MKKQKKKKNILKKILTNIIKVGQRTTKQKLKAINKSGKKIDRKGRTGQSN